MTRPNTTHKGFFVPNAADVAETVLSEPDRIDFNIAGNNRWGVVTGCEVTVSSGTTAEITPGIAVIDGAVVMVTGGQTVVLGNGLSQPRFDLLCIDQAGTLVQIPGAPAANPVFPDPPVSRTVLAAVLVPIAADTLGEYVVDKRNMLQSVLVGTGTGNATLIQNRNGGVDQFRISADGTLMWNDAEVTLGRTSPNILTVIGNLAISGGLSSGTGITTTWLEASENVTASNLVRSDSFPDSGADGTILVKSGIVYFRRSGTWAEATTAMSSDLPGDVKQSMRTPDQMTGWIPMTGQVISEEVYPQLFTVTGLAAFITGSAPYRDMTLPDATDRVLVGGASPGQTGGALSQVLETQHMPSHTHSVSMMEAGHHTHLVDRMYGAGDNYTGWAGAHTHTTTYGGAHRHFVEDWGHRHDGADHFGTQSSFIAVVWGGVGRLDGPVVDASHAYSVDAVNSTTLVSSGVKVSEAESEHQHTTDWQPDHTHTVALLTAGAHVHPIFQAIVGGGAEFSIRNSYLTVYTYLKT